MSCTYKAAKDITNSCDFIPRAGLEPIAWAINREDIDTVTYDGTVENLVTAIALNSGTYAYHVTAIKKEGDAGFDMEFGDDVPDTFLHKFSFKPYEQDAESIQNIDQIQDLVIIAELKGDKGEGCFIILGLEHGMNKASGSQRRKDNHGLPIYEFSSEDGQGERYSRFIFWDTDYSTSKTALESMVAQYGPELFSNEDFSVWTADNPDSWTVSGESGSDPMVTETVNGARIYTSAGVINIRQFVCTAGKTYLVSGVVSNYVSGSLNVTSHGTVTQLSISAAGAFQVEFVQDGGNVYFQRGSAPTDITLESVSCKEKL